jgi:hypothetical protein
VTKRQLIFSAIISALALATVFGFAAVMASQADFYASHSYLSEPLVVAFNVLSLIQAHPFIVAAKVVAGCFGSVWIVGKLFSNKKRLQTKTP